MGHAIGGILGGRAHGELVGVGLTQQDDAGIEQSLNSGGGERRTKSLEDAGAGSRRQALDAQHVLDDDRNAEHGRGG